MAFHFVLTQVLPGGENLAALFAAISHVLCVILLDIVLLYGIVPHEPF